MSVSSVQAVASDSNRQEDFHRTYTIKFRVITDDVLDGPNTVLDGNGVPRLGDSYAFGNDTDGNATARTFAVKLMTEKDSRRLWEVTVSYSTQGGTSDKQSGGNGSGSSPIDWGWRVSGSFFSHMRAPTKDRNGRALVNLVQEPFLPPPEIDDPQLTIVLEKNHPTFSISTWANARGKVNSVAIWGLERRQLKLRAWPFQVHWVSQSFAYTSSRLEFQVNTNPGFYYEPLNCGFRELVGFDEDGKAKYAVARSDDWVPLSRPRLLDEVGQFANDAADPVFFDQAAGDLQRFELEDEYDFSTFLPPALPGPFIP
jgi:hypothetical protein